MFFFKRNFAVFYYLATLFLFVNSDIQKVNVVVDGGCAYIMMMISIIISRKSYPGVRGHIDKISTVLGQNPSYAPTWQKKSQRKDKKI